MIFFSYFEFQLQLTSITLQISAGIPYRRIPSHFEPCVEFDFLLKILILCKTSSSTVLNSR